MKPRTGWKIVCPDGKERHYPYGNHGDAMFDASAMDRGECFDEETGDVCPKGGPHTVEPHVFVPAPPTGSA